MSGKLEGRVALITGGASGIGLASAQLMAREGALVILADIQDEKGVAEAKAIAASGLAEYHHLNVAELRDWEQVAARIKSDHGRLDILVNNAGIVVTGEVDKMSLEDWHRQTAINYDGPFYGMRTCLPLMREGSRGGSIINVASVAGLRPVEWVPAYSATKAALVSLTQCVAMQCGSANDGIRVNAVLPGMTYTPMNVRLDDLEVRTQRLVPLQRPGVPNEIANGILWLASDDSSYVTGLALVIDGGLSVRFPLIAPSDYKTYLKI